MDKYQFSKYNSYSIQQLEREIEELEGEVNFWFNSPNDTADIICGHMLDEAREILRRKKGSMNDDHYDIDDNPLYG